MKSCSIIRKCDFGANFDIAIFACISRDTSAIHGSMEAAKPLSEKKTIRRHADFSLKLDNQTSSPGTSNLADLQPRLGADFSKTERTLRIKRAADGKITVLSFGDSFSNKIRFRGRWSGLCQLYPQLNDIRRRPIRDGQMSDGKHDRSRKPD